MLVESADAGIVSAGQECSSLMLQSLKRTEGAVHALYPRSVV